MQISLILITLTFVVKGKFTTKWIKSDYNLWNCTPAQKLNILKRRPERQFRNEQNSTAVPVVCVFPAQAAHGGSVRIVQTGRARGLPARRHADKRHAGDQILFIPRIQTRSHFLITYIRPPTRTPRRSPAEAPTNRPSHCSAAAAGGEGARPQLLAGGDKNPWLPVIPPPHRGHDSKSGNDGGMQDWNLHRQQ